MDLLLRGTKASGSLINQSNPRRVDAGSKLFCQATEAAYTASVRLANRISVGDWKIVDDIRRFDVRRKKASGDEGMLHELERCKRAAESLELMRNAAFSVMEGNLWTKLPEGKNAGIARDIDAVASMVSAKIVLSDVQACGRLEGGDPLLDRGSPAYRELAHLIKSVGSVMVTCLFVPLAVFAKGVLAAIALGGLVLAAPMSIYYSVSAYRRSEFHQIRKYGAGKSTGYAWLDRLLRLPHEDLEAYGLRLNDIIAGLKRKTLELEKSLQKAAPKPSAGEVLLTARAGGSIVRLATPKVSDELIPADFKEILN